MGETADTNADLAAAIKTAHKAGYTAIASHRSGETEDTIADLAAAIKTAHKAGYTAIASHRSGETADTIADLAAAMNTRPIKTGAPSRSERAEKHNRLLRIEEELRTAARYRGMDAFNVQR